MDMETVYSEAETTRAEIDALKGLTLVEFGTPWCGYCRAAQPFIVTALERHPRVRHIRIQDGRGRRLGRSYGIKLWPTLIFLRDGEETARLIRPKDSSEISKALIQLEARS